jgi:hypothetical protein
VLRGPARLIRELHVGEHPPNLRPAAPGEDPLWPSDPTQRIATLGPRIPHNPLRTIFNDPGTASNYARSWRDLRRRQYLFWIIVLSFLPAMLLSLAIINLLRNDAPEYFGAAIGAVWLAAYVAADFHLHHFRCPRCHGLFSAGYGGQLSRSCTHCQLANGASPFMDDASGEPSHNAAGQPHR